MVFKRHCTKIRTCWTLLTRASWSIPASNEFSSMWVPAPGGAREHSGAWRAAFAAQANTPKEVNIVLVTHLHSDHVGGLTTQDGKHGFPHADVYVAEAGNDL